ncbi:hypothetical protein BBC0122_022900 [Bartonella choladocola]|uniref:Uncharacterized protein n=1 Tax=Bartonella choladocola TaxID=2750995 RepID=A0A1U9MKV5_9HYPH|nr:hypothetical protein BBC0122_022900 [Bartonella choladocola]
MSQELKSIRSIIGEILKKPVSFKVFQPYSVLLSVCLQ